MLIVAGCGGGPLNNVNSSLEFRNRVWNASELHGSMTNDDDLSQGYQFHLDSYVLFSRTEIEIGNGIVKYTIRDLESWSILNEYD